MLWFFSLRHFRNCDFFTKIFGEADTSEILVQDSHEVEEKEPAFLSSCCVSIWGAHSDFAVKVGSQERQKVPVLVPWNGLWQFETHGMAFATQWNMAFNHEGPLGGCGMLWYVTFAICSPSWVARAVGENMWERFWFPNVLWQCKLDIALIQPIRSFATFGLAICPCGAPKSGEVVDSGFFSSQKMFQAEDEAGGGEN